MKRKGMIGVWLMACVVTTGTFAQTTSKILTFEDAVKIALQNGVLLNQQKNNLQLSQMQKVSSLMTLGPNVSLNGTISQFNGNSFNPNAGTVINGVRDNVQGSINANINLFSGFRAVSNAKQFSNLLDAQAYNVNRTSQDVINTVAAQYLQVMLDVELLKIAKENFEALSKQYEQVKEHVNLGSRSPVEEYNQNAQAKGAELRFVQAEIALNNDKALLSQTLLIDPFEQYDVERPNWDINSIGNEVLNSEELAERAKQFRGDYLRASKQEDAQRFAMHASRGAMMPSVFAFGSYGSAYNFQHDVSDSVNSTVSNSVIVFDTSQPTGLAIQENVTSTRVSNPSIPRPFEEQFRQNNVFKQYGIQVTIPILNGFQNRTNYTTQKIAYENAQLNRRNIEYQIRNDVLRTVRNYEGAKKSYSVTIEQAIAAELAFQLETERYSLGVTNFVDFVTANRAFIQAETDKARAEYTLVFQRILIEYAVGTLKPEDLQKQ